MIRSTKIPSVLNRICDNGIYMALMVTSDGELLGVSNRYTPPSSSSSTHESTDVADIPSLVKELPDPESLSTLIADIAMDYYRLGFEFAAFNQNNNNSMTPPTGTPTSSSLTNLDPTSSRQESSSSAGSSSTAALTNNNGNFNNYNNQKAISNMKFLLLEMDYGMIGISSCSSSADCLVIAIATHTTPIGYIKSRLTILASYVQESLYSYQANPSKQAATEPSTSSSGPEPTNNSSSAENDTVVN